MLEGARELGQRASGLKSPRFAFVVGEVLVWVRSVAARRWPKRMINFWFRLNSNLTVPSFAASWRCSILGASASYGIPLTES